VKIWLLHKISKILKKSDFSIFPHTKYYDVHYLRHHTIRILKVETKTIQMRPNIAGYTSGGVTPFLEAFLRLGHYSISVWSQMSFVCLLCV